jgi:vacuolar-type H+-ATPase catalytic subunit A/Vma1
MGDAGEAWVDAEARIQERMEELQQERARPAVLPRKNTEQFRQIKSLELAKRELERQLQAVSHPMRRAQLNAAMADIDRRLAELEALQ